MNAPASLHDAHVVSPVIAGSGEMSHLVRTQDWARSPLGAIEGWPRELLTVVNLALCSAAPTRVLWGSDCILLYNDAYRKFAGARHPEALGRPAREVWGEAWHVVGPQIESVLATGLNQSYERQAVPIARGAEVQLSYLTYSYTPVYQDGRVAGVFGTVQDVTRDVLAASGLIESEARASRILESIGDAVIVTDAATQVTRMNPVAERLTGWRAEDAKGHLLREVFDIINEETRARVENPAEKVTRQGASVGLANHTILRSRLGAEAHIDDSASPIYSDDGDLTGIVLVFRDITGRREAERERERLETELHRQYIELKAIYETSSVALAMIDPVEFRYQRGNPKLAEMLNMPADRIIGTAVFDLATDVQGLREALVTAASGTPVLAKIVEGELANRPGVQRCWQVEYIPVFSAAGEVEVIVASSIEITEQRQGQAALVQNEKLAAMGRLATSIAHEINNPLESVTNLLYLARRSMDMDEVQRYLETADEELRRVGLITSQTLRFHKQATSPTSVRCDELIGSTLLMYQGRLTNATVAVEKRKRCTRPVLCFEGEIRQVLSNLVSNAIDSMQGSGGRLLLRSRAGHDWKTGREGLVITVADTGSGMSAATLKRVFEAFFTTKGIGGTGLGLWVSYEIVERHGGTLRVRSRAGERHGTVFTMFLPFDTVVR
ncbi:MAG: PAS domain-containing protein [Acidobacteriota bacterium]|nr:PAS domain-containing protein [Acidobacteriota bacterium]